MENDKERKNRDYTLIMELSGVDYDIMYLLKEPAREEKYEIILRKRIDIYHGRSLTKQSARITFLKI